ncbi:hypothetical protein PROFUN_01299 [Planoprotostelium fungivorum]|uniref:Uncharacterized protein n=1 Tax=Planoprotostelium fungivorum TaxID=1890364 RepID=A0A2P6NZQ0_9EUKA|nr:hypothetical protein PROFUN_01299 [Planoprotostelium fungivorum]
MNAVSWRGPLKSREISHLSGLPHIDHKHQPLQHATELYDTTMPVREKIRVLLSKSDRASAFSSSFLNRNHNVDPSDPNYAASIARCVRSELSCRSLIPSSYADYTYTGTLNDIPNITQCGNIKESELLMKKFWGDMLACYYPMGAEDLDLLIKQSSRDCKVNCIHKGENLHESSIEGSAFSYTGSHRGRKRMLKKKSKRELKSNEAPVLTETEGGTHIDGARQMILVIADGSEDSIRALHRAAAMIEDTDRDHVIIYTPWNEGLPGNIVEHHLQRQQKHMINEHDSIVLLKAKLREAACAISNHLADVLEQVKPEVIPSSVDLIRSPSQIDYTLIVPGTEDPAGTASIVAAKYNCDWLIIGKTEGEEEEGRERKTFELCGSDRFIAEVQRISGQKVMVV